MTPLDLLRDWTAAVARARVDYATNPTRACHWSGYGIGCDDLRTTDPYYCPRHRRDRDAANAKRKAKP